MDWQEILPLIRTGSFVALIVFVAMMIDLAAGLHKAKVAGVMRTSEALRRTATKFCRYEGSVSLGLLIDILMAMSRLFTAFGLSVFDEVPLFCILIGMFLCVVEFMSIRETTETKALKNERKAARLIAELTKVLSSDKLGEITETIKRNEERSKDEAGE